MSLDKRLRNILRPYFGVAGIENSSALPKCADDIKQAFIDEGWMNVLSSEVVTRYEAGKKPEVYMVNGKEVMTGSELLARFEKELTAMPCDERYVLNGGATTVETHSMSQVEKAARRAAGVDNE